MKIISNTQFLKYYLRFLITRCHPLQINSSKYFCPNKYTSFYTLSLCIFNILKNIDMPLIFHYRFPLISMMSIQILWSILLHNNLPQCLIQKSALCDYIHQVWAKYLFIFLWQCKILVWELLDISEGCYFTNFVP